MIEVTVMVSRNFRTSEALVAEARFIDEGNNQTLANYSRMPQRFTRIAKRCIIFAEVHPEHA